MCQLNSQNTELGLIVYNFNKLSCKLEKYLEKSYMDNTKTKKFCPNAENYRLFRLF